MRPANWARTVARLRTNAQELREHDFEVKEPDSLETPPERRSGNTSDPHV
jgi:hypothetical protein